MSEKLIQENQTPELSTFTRLKTTAILRRTMLTEALREQYGDQQTAGAYLTDREILRKQNFPQTDSAMDYFLSRPHITSVEDMPQNWRERCQAALAGVNDDESFDDSHPLARVANIAIGRETPAQTYREATLIIDAYYLGSVAAKVCDLDYEEFTGRETHLIDTAFEAGQKELEK